MASFLASNLTFYRSAIFTFILSGICSDILSGIYILAFFWHWFWHLFWNVIWHSAFYLTSITICSMSFYPIRHLFWHSFWHSIWHIIWHMFWHSVCHSILTFLSAYVRAHACPTASGARDWVWVQACSTASGACNMVPTMPMSWSRRMTWRRGQEARRQRCGEGGGSRWRAAPFLKSRDPHLTGGGKKGYSWDLTFGISR